MSVRKINWVAPLAIAAGIILVWLAMDPPQWGALKTTPPPSPITSSPASSSTQPPVEPSVITSSHPEEGAYHEHDEERSNPTATPTHEGQENPTYTHTPADQTTAISVSKRFIAAWLTADPAARRAQLAPIAASALVDELSEPRLRIWQASPKGDPTITKQATGAATTEQEFGDGRRVAMLLLYDPTIELRWTVVDVQPMKGS